MDKKVKEAQEQSLIDVLDSALESINQEGTIKNLEINPNGKTCTVIMNIEFYKGDAYFRAP